MNPPIFLQVENKLFMCTHVPVFLRQWNVVATVCYPMLQCLTSSALLKKTGSLCSYICINI